MERVNKILHHQSYNNHMKKTEAAELGRSFCVHNMEHFLNVARIAHILSLENNLNIKKDLIYATALLHDMMRWLEYQDGTPHNLSSADAAKSILEDCEFSVKEVGEIVTAIVEHSGHSNVRADLDADLPSSCWSLAHVIYKADKLSRPCYACPSQTDCHWPNAKKTQTLAY